MRSGGSTADRRQKLSARSFRWPFHQPLLSPTGAHWLDDASDVSCMDSTGQHSVDDPLLSCKQQGWCLGRLLGREPSSQERWSEICFRRCRGVTATKVSFGRACGDWPGITVPRHGKPSVLEAAAAGHAGLSRQRTSRMVSGYR
jgi:hypothetical protein